MSRNTASTTYERTLAMLKPALERVVSDPAFRAHLELDPLAALAAVGVTLDDATRAEFEGKRFSEFWAARRAQVEGPLANRELPPQEQARDEALDDAELEAVAGGVLSNTLLGSRILRSFAPPYVPIGPEPDVLDPTRLK